MDGECKLPNQLLSMKAIYIDFYVMFPFHISAVPRNRRRLGWVHVHGGELKLQKYIF